jgi:RNA polymerase sigma-70 factor, ECF subfamily
MLAVMTTRPLTDHESFRAVVTDDWDWQSLVTFCHSVAAGHTASAALAEDAAQEALIRAWRFRARCREPADPRPWLAAIVRREVLRLTTGHPAEMPVASPPEPPPAEDVVARVDERLVVDAAVARLVRGDRRVLLLRYAGDMTQPQIARVLQIPEGTVKVRLHRARSRLRSVLINEPATERTPRPSPGSRAAGGGRAAADAPARPPG